MRQGSDQLVVIPPEFAVAGEEVDLVRRGDELVIREERRNQVDRSGKPYGVQLVELIQALPEDMFVGIKDERPPEEREGL